MSDSPGSQLAPQPGALVTMMQGRLCPGTTWAEMDFDPWTEGDGALISFTASHHSTVIAKATRISSGFSAAIGLWGSCFIFGNTIQLCLEMQCHDRYTNVRQFLLTEKFYICVCMHP